MRRFVFLSFLLLALPAPGAASGNGAEVLSLAVSGGLFAAGLGAILLAGISRYRFGDGTWLASWVFRDMRAVAVGTVPLLGVSLLLRCAVGCGVSAATHGAGMLLTWSVLVVCLVGGIGVLRALALAAVGVVRTLERDLLDPAPFLEVRRIKQV